MACIPSQRVPARRGVRWSVRGLMSAAAYPTMMQERCDASSRHINVLGRARLDPGSRAPHDHVWREYSCVSVEYREHVIIFDVGSGLRQLGLYLLARDTPPITGSLF